MVVSGANPNRDSVEDFQPRARQLTPSALGRFHGRRRRPLTRFKRLVVGKPIPSHLAHHERLSRVTGLAVLSSDALSSVAYATEEILRVLILVGRRGAEHREPDRARHRDDSGDRRLLVPPDDPRLSERRRRVHRRAREPRRNAGAHGRGRAAHRLRPDGGGQHRGRRRGDHVGVSAWHVRTASRLTLGFVVRPDGRQPARHPRVGPDLRAARPISSS